MVFSIGCPALVTLAPRLFAGYGDAAWQGADRAVVSVIGPSGCGKSTLLMLLSGLDRATSGTIRVGGKIIDRPTSDLGIVFQQDVLLEWRTALENILLQAEIRGMDTKAARG